MTRLSDDKWRKRVERACVEEDDALYRRRGFPLWSLIWMMIAIAALLYVSIGLSGYDRLVKRASEDGWLMLLPLFPFFLLWIVRGLLLLVYLLLRRNYMSSVLLKRMVNWAAVVVAVAATVFLIFFSQRPVPETTVPWVVGTLLTFPLVAFLMEWLYEPLTYLSQRRDLVGTPFLRALVVANSRELQPLVRVDGQTLTPFEPGNAGPEKIKTPLSTLRSVTITMPPARDSKAILEFVDGGRKAIELPSSLPVRERVRDFLQRKLPPSIQITIDNEPPLFGRGGL